MGANMDTVEVVIEIPRGSRNKYEVDESTGVVRLDRVLYSSVHYPTDYGFINGTHAGDGAPRRLRLRRRAEPVGLPQVLTRASGRRREVLPQPPFPSKRWRFP